MKKTLDMVSSTWDVPSEAPIDAGEPMFFLGSLDPVVASRPPAKAMGEAKSDWEGTHLYEWWVPLANQFCFMVRPYFFPSNTQTVDLFGYLEELITPCQHRLKPA